MLFAAKSKMSIALVKKHNATRGEYLFKGQQIVWLSSSVLSDKFGDTVLWAKHGKPYDAVLHFENFSILFPPKQLLDPLE